MTLSPQQKRILERCAFDESVSNADARQRESIFHGVSMTAFQVEAARYENARLIPIIEALLTENQRLVSALEKIAAEDSRYAMRIVCFEAASEHAAAMLRIAEEK